MKQKAPHFGKREAKSVGMASSVSLPGTAPRSLHTTRGLGIFGFWVASVGAVDVREMFKCGFVRISGLVVRNVYYWTG